MSQPHTIFYFPGVVLYRLFLGVTFFLVLCVIWPIFLFRYLLSHLAPILRPDLGLILTPESRSMLPVSSACFNMIVQFKLSGKLDYPLLVNQVAEKCILLRDKDTGKFKFPEFQQYVTTWLGYPFWKNDENFQMNYHLRHLLVESEKDIELEYQKAIERPFSTDTSPWRATFVEIKDDRSCHYIWFTFHHSLADGISLSKALMSAADLPVQQLQPSPEVRLSFWTRFLQAMNFILTYFRTLHKIIQLVQLSWDFRDLTPVYFMTSMDSIPLTQVKALSQKFGVSVSAVLISLVAGAIRRKFLTEGVSEPPSNLRGYTIVPLAHPENNLINEFLFFDFKYPLEKTEVVERVTDIEMQIQWERQMKSSLVLHFIIFLLGSFPWSVPITPTNDLSNPLTIFPGPTAPVYLGGNPVQDITFTMNMNAQSFYASFISILSYNGKLRFSINVNGRICPSQSSVEEFSAYLLEELQEMNSSPSNPNVEINILV